MTRKFTAEQVIEAVKDSDGVIALVARRLHCRWNTAARYINLYPTAKAALEDETNTLYDEAERIIYTNIRLLRARQEAEGRPVESYDAWRMLTQTRRGRERGFSERQEVSGTDGNALHVIVEYVDRSDTTTQTPSKPGADQEPGQAV
jgi:hypothetical protein